MFYRIKDNNLYDYADYQYAEDCFKTTIITKTELDKDVRQVIIKNNKIALNPNYTDIQKEKENNKKIFEIKSQINELDLKRIRAIVEGGTNPNTKKTYLEEYTEQIIELRNKINEYS